MIEQTNLDYLEIMDIGEIDFVLKCKDLYWQKLLHACNVCAHYFLLFLFWVINILKLIHRNGKQID